MVSLRARGAALCRAGVGMLCLLLVATPGMSSARAEAVDSSLNGSASRTRFVIALDRTVDFQVSSLNQPNRVIVDLPDVNIRLPGQPANGPVGLVKSFRGGLAAPGQVKVVIDVTDPVIVERSVLEPAQEGRGPRLVLDIVPVRPRKYGNIADFAKAKLGGAGLGSLQPPVPRPAKRNVIGVKRLIVLDPGHGGHDSGASRNGAVEKHVVLAFSLVLRDMLNATGRYDVRMTRDSDKFVPLDDRRDFAERHNAELFMAIHADYAGSRASGATIYSLRNSVADRLERQALGEVGRNVLSDSYLRDAKRAGVGGGGAVEAFLADLARREVKSNQALTSVLTRKMLDSMDGATPIMNNPDRSAAFRVLKTATVPAVLLELAYVSNKKDAANLKSAAWRRKVAATIMTAIDKYFADQRRNVFMR